MDKDAAILVGDRFENFAKNPEVRRLSDFMATTRQGAAVERRLYLGQGISSQEFEAHLVELRERAPECGLASPQRASCKATHKVMPQNVMISEPRQLSADIYEVDLLIDARSEVIADHQTGQHIQGLALIEASRQTWTAVAERYLLQHARPTRFVLEEVSAKFKNFVFPLPALLTLTLLEAKVTPMQSTFSVCVTIDQSGRRAAEIMGKFRIIDERIQDRQEMIAARVAVEAFLAGNGGERLGAR